MEVKRVWLEDFIDSTFYVLIVNELPVEIQFAKGKTGGNALFRVYY